MNIDFSSDLVFYLSIGAAVGLVVGIGYAVIESRLFDLWQRRRF